MWGQVLNHSLQLGSSILELDYKPLELQSCKTIPKLHKTQKNPFTCICKTPVNWWTWERQRKRENYCPWANFWSGKTFLQRHACEIGTTSWYAAAVVAVGIIIIMVVLAAQMSWSSFLDSHDSSKYNPKYG